MKIFITIVFAIFCFIKVSATDQNPDIIIFNNKVYPILTNPLEKYFEKNEDKRPKGEGVVTSDLWRGYVATFEIIFNQLFVIDIKIQTWNVQSEKIVWKSVINEVFPIIEERKINWFNGLLTLPYGEIIKHGYLGSPYTYGYYILIEFEKGKSIKYKNLDFKEYENIKEKQFEAYKKTNEYLEERKRLKKRGLKQKDIDDLLRIGIIEKTEKLLIE